MTRNRAIALMAFIITISIIIYPEASFRASLNGLKLWFEIVLPALLPFFAMADILMGLGAVHFIGALLEPIMRPVFRIPGVGGFAVAMGLAAGYPMGAKITGELHRRQLCSAAEAERLVSFANTADPLFIVGAVSIGMFGLPDLGATLVLSHYIAAIIVGFCMRFHQGEDSVQIKRSSGYFSRALRELDEARRQDGRSFGLLFGESVRDTFTAMLFIGGCIMMFSVLIEVLTVSGLMGYITNILSPLLRFAGMDPSLSVAVVNGFFETTIGAQSASVSSASLVQKAMAASFVIGWSGLSVHTQVTAMLHGTEIRLLPYLTARLLHGVLAAACTAILLGPAKNLPTLVTKAVPALSGSSPAASGFGNRLLASTQWASMTALGLLGIGAIIWIARRIIYIPFKNRR
ncbi:MAG: sporulation integral membrane protein YlbJ [Firmicutes bacterium]|nr:sporulation integral membrane protein YlbJ [Bacillota bacterium]